MRRAFLPLLLLLAAAVPAAAQQTHVLLVSGLSGEPRFAAQWSEWIRQLSAAASGRHGVPAANITVLSEQGAGGARSTRDNVLAALRALAARAGAGDDVVLVLFGHGSESAGEARINLAGPDLTARELAGALAALPARRVTVVNTASASGAFVKPLAGANRIIIAATKSGAEQNETLFGRFFVAALTGSGADTDKDERVSMLEAFLYASREVERAYAGAQRLQTEHPVLEADGDGVGSPAPQPAGGDGAAAALAFLGSGPAAGSGGAANAELRALQAEKARIEADLEALRRRRAGLAEAEYQRELEKLLLELSRNGQAIRRLQERGR